MKIGNLIKFLCFLIMLSPLLSSQVPSTATWKPASLMQPPIGIDPKDIRFHEIFVSQDDNGWASFVAGKGAEFYMARSQDGGMSWKFLPPLPQYGYIDSIFFLDANRGWVSTNLKEYVDGASSAVLLHTTDGGLSWEKWSDLEPLKVRGLFGIHFDRNGDGIAAGVVMPGGNGVILRTSDFGKTWRIQQKRADADYYRGTAVHNDVAWALSHRRILVGEKGSDWETVLDLKDQYLGMSIDAPTETRVAAVTDWGNIVLSEDKGKTWKVIPFPAPYEELHLGAVKFADPRHGWVVGLNGVILATNDGGNTWEFEAQVNSTVLSDIAVSTRNVVAIGQGAIYWRSRP